MLKLNYYTNQIAHNVNTPLGDKMFNLKNFLVQCTRLQQILPDLDTLLAEKDVKKATKYIKVQEAYTEIQDILLAYDEKIIPLFTNLQNIYGVMDNMCDDLSEIFHSLED